MTFDKVAVIGLGYIGLPTAAVLASRKLRVVGVDVRQSTVDTINAGAIHIVEPDLDIVVQACVKEGFLRASTAPEAADAFLIAVPTPFDPATHRADLSCVEQACRAIAPVLAPGNLVILESTCPVGTTEQLADWLAQLRPDLSFPQQVGDGSQIRIAYCPERVLPGHVLRELVYNDRVVGGMTPRCAEAAAALYRLFLRGECFLTRARTAELCKLAENSFRDVNIAFANELSMLCGELDVDVWELIRLANRHPRVNILQPGPGVGGHCIAVDPWFIVSSCPPLARLIRTAREVNDSKPQWVVERVENAVASWHSSLSEGASREPRIACLGLTFKADIDDLRESPAVAITAELARRFPGSLLVVEPNIHELPPALAGKAGHMSLEDALANCDIAVLLVDHKAFRALPLAAFAGKQVVDTRGLFSLH